MKAPARLFYITLVILLMSLTSGSMLAFDNFSEIRKNLLIGNYVDAAKQLKKLSLEGNLNAKYQLSLLYLKGRGVRKSVKQAEILLIDASKLAPDAAYLLGALYLKGNQLKENKSKALHYLKLAASSGNRKAKQLLKSTKFKHTSEHSVSLSNQKIIKSAINNDNLARLKQLQTRGISLGPSFQNGDSPLIYAIKRDRKVIVTWLVGLTINLNQKNALGNTALHISVINHRLDLLKILTKTHTSLNLLNHNKQSALMIAIDLNDREAINWLIKQGANIPQSYKKDQLEQRQINYLTSQLLLLKDDPSSQYYNWPLITIAAAHKRNEVVVKLLETKHSPWQAASDGSFAINIILMNKNYNLTKKILAVYPINAQQNAKQIRAFFLTAVMSEQIDFIEIALKRSEQLNLPQMIEDGLNLSVQNTYLISLKYFLKRLKSIPSQNLLMTSISQNNVQVTRALLEAGCPLYSVDENSKTPLVKAIELKNPNMINLLIEFGAKINELDINGISPLMLAIKADCNDCARALLKENVNFDIISKSGNTAILYAAQKSNEILVLLLRKNHDIKHRNKLSFTALMLAIKSNCRYCVKTLLDEGANPRRKTQMGQDSYALAINKPEILKILNTH